MELLNLNLVFLLFAAGSVRATPQLNARQVGGEAACTLAADLINACSIATPNFISLPTSSQAACLCYGTSSSWVPTVFDGLLATCVSGGTNSALVSDASVLSGFCSKAGNVLKVPASATAIPTGTAAQGGIAQCSSVLEYIDICDSLTPGFTNLPPSSQASCLCYSSTKWVPDIFDEYIQSCETYAKTADVSLYTIATELDNFCASVGDVIGTAVTAIATQSSVSFHLLTQSTTGSSTSSTSSSTGTGVPASGGLSSGAKIGIGVGIPLALIAIGAIAFAFFWRSRNKSKNARVAGTDTTAQNYNPGGQGGPVPQVTTYYPPPMEAPQQQHYQGQPEPNYQPPVNGGVTESYAPIKHEYQPAYSPAPQQSPVSSGFSGPTSPMPLSPELAGNEIQPQGPLSGNWQQPQQPQPHPAGVAEKE